MIPELKDVNYEEGLEFLKLPYVTYRRLRGDAIEMYKYTHNIYQVAATPYNLNEDISRMNNGIKIIKERCTYPHRRQFFGNCVNYMWNVLPPEVIQAPSTNSFKSRLNIKWKNHFIITDVRIIQHNRNSKKNLIILDPTLGPNQQDSTTDLIKEASKTQEPSQQDFLIVPATTTTLNPS